MVLEYIHLGDIELNPGPPKKGGGNKPKEPTKEEQMKMLQDKVSKIKKKRNMYACMFLRCKNMKIKFQA